MRFLILLVCTTVALGELSLGGPTVQWSYELGVDASLSQLITDGKGGGACVVRSDDAKTAWSIIWFNPKGKVLYKKVFAATEENSILAMTLVAVGPVLVYQVHPGAAPGYFVQVNRKGRETRTDDTHHLTVIEGSRSSDGSGFFAFRSPAQGAAGPVQLLRYSFE